jgi:hypothetical protein
MPCIIRPITALATLHPHLSLDALGQIVPHTAIITALDTCHAHEQRTRKLPAPLVVLLCIAMNLYAADALTHVLFRLLRVLRWSLPDPGTARVTKSAICQARQRLGARPLITLFQQLCRPLATAAMPDAFLFGLRPLALDRTTLDLPDTPANAATFGRPRNQRGAAAWPQAAVVALIECATHAPCDATLSRCTASAARVGRTLVRSVGRGDLVLWDREFHSFALVAAVEARDAELLGRLPASAHPRVLRTLTDGTLLVRIQPSEREHRQAGEAMTLRLIRYTLDDPARPGHAVEHRLVTSLVDPAHAPADQLVIAYHARWEWEVAMDEIKTHQRPATPLRSEKPVGVIQEIFALLLAHYVVRAVMADAAAMVGLPPVRLSFLGALRVIREAVPELQGGSRRQRRRVYRQLLADIVAVPLPPRANRCAPRVVKQQQSPYNVKRPQHRHWRHPTQSFHDAIVLLN